MDRWGRYHSRQKRKVICSRAFFWGSCSEGAGEADMFAMGEGAVARVIAKEVVLDMQWYLVASDVSLLSRCIWILGCRYSHDWEESLTVPKAKRKIKALSSALSAYSFRARILGLPHSAPTAIRRTR